MSSIFTKIIKGIIPVYKIAEDEHHLAFLDKYPLKIGHTLVIPKKEIDKIYDLKKEEFTNLMNFTLIIIKSIENTISCKRIGLSVLGFEIAHAHIHLIPIDQESDIDFSKQRIKCTNDVLLDISIKLNNTYNKIYNYYL